MFFFCCKSSSADAVVVLEGKCEQAKPNAKSVSFSTNLPELNAHRNRSSLISSIHMLNPAADSLLTMTISEDGAEGEDFPATDSERNTRSTYLAHSIKPIEGNSLKASMTSTIISDAKTNVSFVLCSIIPISVNY